LSSLSVPANRRISTYHPVKQEHILITWGLCLLLLTPSSCIDWNISQSSLYPNHVPWCRKSWHKFSYATQLPLSNI